MQHSVAPTLTDAASFTLKNIVALTLEIQLAVLNTFAPKNGEISY